MKAVEIKLPCKKEVESMLIELINFKNQNSVSSQFIYLEALKTGLLISSSDKCLRDRLVEPLLWPNKNLHFVKPSPI